MREFDKIKEIADAINRDRLSLSEIAPLIKKYGLINDAKKENGVCTGRIYTIKMSKGKAHIKKLERNPDRLRIGKTLQEAREKRGVSLEELAKKLDIKVGTIEKIECGAWAYTIDQMSMICSALGCTIQIVDPMEDKK